MQPRVISYVRFSSQRQSKGRSEDRQNVAARVWCERNNLSLDENIQDLGVSAFTGKHRKKGNLSAFLEEVNAGTVPPGSYLLGEAFDRLGILFSEELRSRCAHLRPTSIVKGMPQQHKWKVHNPEGIERILDRIRPLMRELGYDPED